MSTSMDKRKAVLAERVRAAVSNGMSIEEQTETRAIVVAGKPLNHALHYFISLFGGLWLIGWLILSIKGGERREMLTVDEHGNVTSRNIGRDSVLIDRLYKLALGGKHTTQVRASPEKAFDRIARLGFIKEGEGWFGPTAIHGLVGQPVSLGSVFSITHSNQQGTFTNEFEVVEFVTDQKLVYEMRRGGMRGRRRLTWTVEPEGSGTRITLANEHRRFVNHRFHPLVTVFTLLTGTVTTFLLSALVFGLFMLPFMWPAMKWEARTAVRRIKHQVE